MLSGTVVPGGQSSWWVREARTLLSAWPTLGRIGRLAHTRPPGEQVTVAMSMVAMVVVLLLAALLPSCHCYCKSLGWNPSFNGPPLVEQVHTQTQHPSHARLQCICSEEARAKSDKLVYKGGLPWNKFRWIHFWKWHKTDLHFSNNACPPHP